ncbi:MAG: hypothetical protein AAGP08_11685 [Pseudomonadota bacterium]
MALALYVLPSSAWAEVCAQIRPAWDGAPVTALQEALYLAGTAPVLVLVIASALVIRLRNQWGGLAVIVLWTVLITFIIRSDPSSIEAQASAEGCIGSPALFITAVAAICVAIVLRTLPLRPKTGD